MKHRIDQMSKEYNITKKELKELYPFSWFYQEFLKILYEAGDDGKRIPDIVLDKLQKMNREYIIKIYNTQHRDYMPPEVKKFNKENKFMKTPGRKRKVY